MKLNYYIKSIYGTDNMYLIDEGAKKALKLFNGHKTLTVKDMEAFKLMGYTFTEVLAPRN